MWIRPFLLARISLTSVLGSFRARYGRGGRFLDARWSVGRPESLNRAFICYHTVDEFDVSPYVGLVHEATIWYALYNKENGPAIFVACSPFAAAILVSDGSELAAAVESDHVENIRDRAGIGFLIRPGCNLQNSYVIWLTDPTGRGQSKYSKPVSALVSPFAYENLKQRLTGN